MRKGSRERKKSREKDERWGAVGGRRRGRGREENPFSSPYPLQSFPRGVTKKRGVSD